MDQPQQTVDSGHRRHSMKAIRDLIWIAVAIIIVLILSYFFNIFIIIVKFLRNYPEKIVYVDEVVVGLLTLSIGLAIFAWRRWLDLKKETAERLKKQEELLRITETHAEVEKIINKQLHGDMDQMKQDVREILRLVVSRVKRPE